MGLRFQVFDTGKDFCDFKSIVSVICGVKYFMDLSGQRFCLATVAAARPAPRP